MPAGGDAGSGCRKACGYITWTCPTTGGHPCAPAEVASLSAAVKCWGGGGLRGQRLLAPQQQADKRQAGRAPAPAPGRPGLRWPWAQGRWQGQAVWRAGWLYWFEGLLLACPARAPGTPPSPPHTHTGCEPSATTACTAELTTQEQEGTAQWDPDPQGTVYRDSPAPATVPGGSSHNVRLAQQVPPPRGPYTAKVTAPNSRSSGSLSLGPPSKNEAKNQYDA